MRFESKEKDSGNAFMLIGVALALILATAGGLLIANMSTASSDRWDADAENRDNPVDVDAIQRSLGK